MADATARKALADRAAVLWQVGGVTYSQAIDAALDEQNPTDSPAVAGVVIQTLLNVDDTAVLDRIREGGSYTPRKRPRAAPTPWVAPGPVGIVIEA